MSVNHGNVKSYAVEKSSEKIKKIKIDHVDERVKDHCGLELACYSSQETLAKSSGSFAY